MNRQICGELEDFITKYRECGKSFCEYCGDQEPRVCYQFLKKARAK